MAWTHLWRVEDSKVSVMHRLGRRGECGKAGDAVYIAVLGRHV